MKIFRTICDVTLILLTVISVIISFVFAYYYFFVDDITMGTNNIGDQLGKDVVQNIESSDNLTDEQRNAYEERYFIHANYYSNDKKNGIALQEMQLNYFTSHKLQSTDYRSSGMQFIGNFDYSLGNGNKNQDILSEYIGMFLNKDEADVFIDKSFYYYDTTNGISWNGLGGNTGGVSTVLTRKTNFIIKIDNRAFSIQLNGKEDFYRDQKFLGFLWKTGKQELYKTHYYLYRDLFYAVMNAVKSNNAGYGDYYITLDLSKYFTIRELDMETGKYKADSVTDIIKNYSVLKFSYNENGAVSSNQSLFGLIECNRKYAFDEGEVIDPKYWQERMVYNLKAEDLETRYSDIDGGNYVSLSLKMQQLFKKMGRVKVNISIDIDKYNIIGFDFNAFENFEIDTITIIGKPGTPFEFLDKSLYNSNVRTIKHSNGLVFNIADNAINNDYTEVII